MNLMLLEESDFIAPTTALISGRRCEHLVKILKVSVSSRVTIGLVNGPVGLGVVSRVTAEQVTLLVETLNTPPPATLPLTLILALPRPRQLQRTLQTLATMGVKRLCLIQTARVEKSYWQTPLLKPAAVREQLILGLEQAKATQLPEVSLHTRFRPFIEDEVPQLAGDAVKLIAHPGPYPAARPIPLAPTQLAIGPEGGFLDKEVEHFKAQGYNPIQLGPRILKVETAIPVLLGRLFP